MTRKALGRGLEALIPTKSPPSATLDQTSQEPEPENASGSVREVPIDDIIKNPYQPRVKFDSRKIDELAKSIQENGILQPLLVRENNGKYELIAGERRLRAARLAGLLRIPVFIRRIANKEKLQLAILENVQREDLNPIEEAHGYQQLVEDFGMTHGDIAERLGKSVSYVINSIRLLKLPEPLQARIEKGEFTAGHARALLAAESLEEQTHIANLIREEGLTVRQVERITQQRKRRRASGGKTEGKNSQGMETALLELQKRLEAKMGTRVRIKSSRKDGSSGRIEISYYNEGDLERIFGMVGVEYLL